MVELFVAFDALVFHIVLYHVEVAVLTNSIGIISLGPEVSSPEFLLNFGMCFEYMACSDAFDLLYHI